MIKIIYNPATLGDFMGAYEYLREHHSISAPQIAIARPITTKVDKESGPFEKEYLKKTGKAFIRMTGSVMEFMQSEGMDRESYCQYLLNGSESSESMDDEAQREIPEGCEIDLNDVV